MWRYYLLVALLCATFNVVWGANTVTMSPSDPGMAWSGNWDIPGATGCNGEKLRTSSQKGASMTATFTGTAVYLDVTVAWDRGDVSIQLDGVDKGNLQSWIIDFTGKVRECKTIFSAEGLENKEHVLTATISGSNMIGISKLEIIDVKYVVPDPPAQNTPPPATTAQATTTTQPGPVQSVPAEPVTGPASSSTTPLGATGTDLASLASGTGSSTDIVTPSGSSTSTDTPSGTLSLPAISGATTAPPLASHTSTVPVTADVSPDDPRIQYVPASAWQIRNSSECTGTNISSRVGSQPGAMISFPFKGSAIILKTLPDILSGGYMVSIDGSQVASLSGIIDTTACTNALSSYQNGSLVDDWHVIAITIANNGSTTRKRAGGSEFTFAGFRYTGLDATSTNEITSPSPPDPSSASSSNAAAIGGGIAAAVVVLLIIAFGVLLLIRRVRRRAARNMAPSAMFARQMQINSSTNRPTMDSISSWPSDPAKGDPAQYNVNVEYEQPAPPYPAAEPPQSRWSRPRSFAAISAWKASVLRSSPSGPSHPPPQPSSEILPPATTFPLDHNVNSSSQPPHTLSASAHPPRPSDAAGEKAMLYQVYNR